MLVPAQRRRVWARLRRLPEGEERDTAEGDLYAQLTQLESAAEVAREGMDAVSDALPDDDE